MKDISEYISSRTLRRTVERYLGKDSIIPDEYVALLSAINTSFGHLENDRQMLERSMELSSDELIAANTKLKEEARQSNLLLQQLQESLIALGLFDATMTNMDLLAVASVLRQQIDQRIMAEKESATLLQRTQQIIDTSLDAVVISDVNGVITGWNNAAERIFGWSFEQIAGKRITETIIPPKFAPVVERSLVQYRNTRKSTVLNKRIELTATHAQGRTFPIELTITAVETAQGSSFTSFIRDISERKQAEQSLIEAKLQAESANRAKSAFLSSMSHELRTPLNSIIGFAQILIKEENLPEQQRNFLQIMYNSGNHLLEMINDILDISKIESGQMELMTDTMDLYRIMQDVDEAYRVRCLSKGLRLNVEVDSHIPRFVLGDAKRMKQILFNLLGNAVKFTTTGSINLRVQKRKTIDHNHICLRFSVEDTGRGIANEQIQHLFHPFRQGNGMHSEGTGLGLAICAHIVSLMGGNIAVHSTVGKGSCFHVDIPFLIENVPSQFQHNALPSLRPHIKGGRQPKVLIVDDIQNNRLVARIMLEAIGFVCHEAADGIEAIELNQRLHPDIILMDIRMPNMDGITAMKAIRAKHGTNLPIIALTASGFDGKRQSLIADGFSEYLRKPFREEDLLYILERTAGISFEYNNAGQETSNGSSNEVYHDIMSFMNSLPPNLKQELLDALQVQNLSAIEEILHSLGDVEEQHREATAKLLQAVQSFDVGLLIRLSELYA